jgi:RNA polymerase sigma factor (sigma-70 family)
METLDGLVRAVQEGNADAFNRIIERFQDMAYASAYAIIGDAQSAEDVAQEAFLDAFLNLTKLREPAAFSSWFRSIIFKQADRLTRGKRLAKSPLEEAADIPISGSGPTEIVETNEMRLQVRNAIVSLPEHERLVIVLFYGTGYALKEIATFLDLPVTTIKKRLYTGRQRLKDELIDLTRDVLQEQRISLSDTFPAKVRLLIAARLGDIATVSMLLTHSPMLLNMKIERNEVKPHSGIFIARGLTALHEAAMNNHVAVALLLLDYGANSDTRTSAGLTPLHGAILNHCHEMAIYLLTQGANAELPLSNGLTALHLAAINGDIPMVRLLMQHGVIIDCRSQHARTPLHWAAIKGHAEIVQLLLSHGADQHARDLTGRTPCDWALARNNTQLTTLFQERITQ